VAATVVWGDATEALMQRQSPSAESAASAPGAEMPGQAADAGQRGNHRGINGSGING